jgi:NADH-quinone oxidoreductase subunit L
VVENTIYHFALVAVLSPLIGCLIAGLFGKKIGVLASQLVTIAGIAISFFCALSLSKWILFDHIQPLNQTVYIWGTSGNLSLSIGFLIDQLTVLMMSIVTFVSLLVHIYSIGYMEGDPGIQRFFSYMSLFTFGMLSLVMANNFLLLFFGWETVGLVSYLLIGFWFKKESAALGGFKAFIVNRVGDFGFLLGIAVILSYFGTLDYATVFAEAPKLVGSTLSLISNVNWSVLTVICLLLFVGAMGKSAQLPLHIWLPESMEGGPDNPLGARALYLGSSLYRIHGSNEPETIGQAVSSGCFRLTNEDVIDLYNRVPVGATVIVQR